MFINTLIIIAACGNVFLGIIAILRHNYRRPVNSTFSAFAFITGFWALSNFIFILFPTILTIRFSFALGSLVPAAATSWLIIFKSEKIKKWDNIIIIMLLVFGIFFFITSISGDSIVQYFEPSIVTGVLFPYYALLFSTSIIIPLIISLNIYKRSGGIKKEQSKYILVGLIFFGLISLFSSLILPLFGLFQFSRLDSPSSLFFVGLSAYAIIRHRLLDIRLIITRSIIYFFLVIFVTAAFTSIILISTTLFSEVLGVNTFLISAVGALIVVIGLDPLKKWLSDVTDKVFFKARVDFQELMHKLSVVISKEYEVEPLVNSVTAALTEGLKIESSSMMMKQKDGSFRSSSRAPGQKELSIDKHSALIRYLKIKQHVSVLESLQRRIEDTTNESERSELEKSRHDFETINASVVSPVISENELKAVLVLGQKRSGDSFSTDEMRVMDVIGPQIATAIEKATLFDEVKDLSENLQQKVYQATGELQERNTSLVALQNINNLITRSLEIRKVNQSIVDSIANELGHIGAILIYLDEANNKLHAAAVTETNLTKRAMRMLPKPIYDYTTDLATDKTLDALAIKDKEIKIATSMVEFFSPPIPKPIMAVINKLLGVKTIIAIPLYSEGRVIGVMDIATKKSRSELSERDLEVLEAIADQTGIVARNLSLFDKLKETNVQLEEANSHLQQLDQAKTEFVSIASHQLRTPMTGIMGYLSMMTQGDFGKVKAKHQKILTDLLEESQRMIRLINLFLNVSKIEAGKFDIDLRPMQIEDVIQSEIKEIAKPAKEKGIKVIFKKPKLKLKPVMGDVDKLKDVVLNLLDNGVKYTAKGSLTITAEQNDREVHVSVKDTGVGIKPSDARELFAKFVRGSGIARIHPDGSGLGLFIAKKIIEAHHGMIWVESEGEGKGSTFQFVIPFSKK